MLRRLRPLKGALRLSKGQARRVDLEPANRSERDNLPLQRVRSAAGFDEHLYVSLRVAEVLEGLGDAI